MDEKCFSSLWDYEFLRIFLKKNLRFLESKGSLERLAVLFYFHLLRYWAFF